MRRLEALALKKKKCHNGHGGGGEKNASKSDSPSGLSRMESVCAGEGVLSAANTHRNSGLGLSIQFLRSTGSFA